MLWRPYKPCCHVSALDRAALYCPECRHPLLRCHGFSDCNALVEPLSHCPVHVAPALILEAGGLAGARRGDRLSLPLLVKNCATVGFPLRIHRVLRQCADGDYSPIELPWEKIGPGQERRFSIDSDVLETGGRYGVRLILELVVRYAEHEECYAFAAEVGLKVEGGEGGGQVVQYINVKTERIEAGGSAVMQTGPSQYMGSGAATGVRDAGQSQPVPLERAERFELAQGIRGYDRLGCAIPRTVELHCEGFAGAEAPGQSTPFLGSHTLGIGRSATDYRPDDKTPPNFICLRAYDGSGNLDADLSRQVSRRHFELELTNGRLYLRNLGRTGTHNGRPLACGDRVVIGHEDVVSPLNLPQGGLDLRLQFEHRGDQVERIRLLRGG
jgi:hypothetical protein